MAAHRIQDMSDTTLGEAPSDSWTPSKGPARQPPSPNSTDSADGTAATAQSPTSAATTSPLYGESMGPATPETTKRAEQIRAFLVFLKKEGDLGAEPGAPPPPPQEPAALPARISHPARPTPLQRRAHRRRHRCPQGRARHPDGGPHRRPRGHSQGDARQGLPRELPARRSQGPAGPHRGPRP